MSEKRFNCQKIVQAARERFSHFGYCKTTMSEIAQDCKMSPGNIYRFFPGKLDIAEQIADENTDKRLENVRAVIRDKNLSPVQKLWAFLLDSLRVTFQTLDEDPRIAEVAEMMARERPEFLERQMAKERALIAEILSLGNACGDFNIDDILLTARMIQAVTLKYKYPQLHSALTLPQLEKELDGVVDLIVNGLHVRQSAPADQAPVPA